MPSTEAGELQSADSCLSLAAENLAQVLRHFCALLVPVLGCAADGIVQHWGESHPQEAVVILIARSLINDSLAGCFISCIPSCQLERDDGRGLREMDAMDDLELVRDASSDQADSGVTSGPPDFVRGPQRRGQVLKSVPNAAPDVLGKGRAVRIGLSHVGQELKHVLQ